MRPPLFWRFKRGVNRNVRPETALWMNIIAEEYVMFCGFEGTPCSFCVITSAYRPGDPGAHGRKEAFDLKRQCSAALCEKFCRQVQKNYGRYIGVVLEPEWGKGAGYTGPHMHFQLKKPALWKEVT